MIKYSRDRRAIEDKMIKSTNVLVLYTGGTIGMYATKDGLKCKSHMADFLKKLPMLHDHEYKQDLSRKKPDIPEQVDEIIMPLSEYGVRVFYYIKEYENKMDSSNMQMNDWVDIAMDVKDNYDKFDSFIILHGTDTMSYTASALSFMFQNLNKCVILAGSQIPIFEQRNDGRDNLLGALMIAGHFVIPEVTLFFHGKLYRGNRTTKINSGELQAFDSPNLLALATIEVNININWDAILRNERTEHFYVHTHLNPNVGILRLFPGITDATVEAICSAPVEGIVLETFGAGNCPNRRIRFIEILKKTLERGVIIVNCTQCLKGAVKKMYETGEILFKIGVITGYDITPEAALTKLSYVLSFSNLALDEKKQLMENSIRGEMSVSDNDRKYTLSGLITSIASTPKASSMEDIEHIKKILHPILPSYSRADDAAEKLVTIDDGESSGDLNKATPLEIAVCNGDVVKLKTLLQNGVFVNKLDKDRTSLLMDAIRLRKNDVIKLLCDYGARIDKTIISRMTADICKAASNNDISLLHSWKLAEGSFDVTNNTGRTPLHEAVCSYAVESVKFLLACDVNLDIRDNLGHTALDCVNMMQTANEKNILKIGELRNKSLLAVHAALVNSMK